jgi:hypothetical protein
VTATRTFTVLPHQILNVHATLAGGGILPSPRQLRIEADGSVHIVTAAVGGPASPATVTIEIPAGAVPSCVRVKDTLHSIAQSVAPTAAGNALAASVALDQGDSNDDNLIDILDFGLFVLDFGMAAPSGRSNFNGDAFVNNDDFTFISFNFFKVGSQACSGSGGDGGLAGHDPVDRISVPRLRKLGLGDLAAADLNGDGWLDTGDIALWMRGVRPGAAAADPISSGNSTE